MNGGSEFAQLSAAVAGDRPVPVSRRRRHLSLATGDVLDGDMSAQAVSCGTPFLLVPLSDRAAVGRSRFGLDL